MNKNSTTNTNISLLRSACRLVKNTLFSRSKKRKTWRGRLDFAFFIAIFLLVASPIFSNMQRKAAREETAREGEVGREKPSRASSRPPVRTSPPSAGMMHTLATQPRQTAAPTLAERFELSASRNKSLWDEPLFSQLQGKPQSKASSVGKTSSIGTLTFRGQKMHISRETLWLARCLYSESRRPREQELVAWVIRNRVETGFRGRTTYQEVVLDPYQFSAFNPDRRYSRRFYTHLDPEDIHPGWRRTLAVAWHVQHAAPSENPFKENTRHFYSPVSMPGGRPASWTDERRRAYPKAPWRPEPHRFRFYSNIGPQK